MSRGIVGFITILPYRPLGPSIGLPSQVSKRSLAWDRPGILAGCGAELVARGKVARRIDALVFFSAIPIVVWIVQKVDIPWEMVGPMILIGIGVILLVKAFYLGGQGETEG